MMNSYPVSSEETLQVQQKHPTEKINVNISCLHYGSVIKHFKTKENYFFSNARPDLLPQSSSGFRYYTFSESDIKTQKNVSILLFLLREASSFH